MRRIGNGPGVLGWRVGKYCCCWSSASIFRRWRYRSIRIFRVCARPESGCAHILIDCRKRIGEFVMFYSMSPHTTDVNNYSTGR
jgi:hypothetical protein